MAQIAATAEEDSTGHIYRTDRVADSLRRGKDIYVSAAGKVMMRCRRRKDRQKCRRSQTRESCSIFRRRGPRCPRETIFPVRLPFSLSRDTGSSVGQTEGQMQMVSSARGTVMMAGRLISPTPSSPDLRKCMCSEVHKCWRNSGQTADCARLARQAGLFLLAIGGTGLLRNGAVPAPLFSLSL